MRDPDLDWPCQCEECASPHAECDICGVGAGLVCATSCEEHPSRRPTCARLGALGVSGGPASADVYRWHAVQAQRHAARAAAEARASAAEWERQVRRAQENATPDSDSDMGCRS